MEKITFKKTPIDLKIPKNEYAFNIKAILDDGERFNKTVFISGDKLSEKDILVISYISMNKIPKQWQSGLAEICNQDCFPFGSNYIEENHRFGKGWLDNYVCEKLDFLPMIYWTDTETHSISKISITFYDDDRNPFKCGCPNIAKIFPSESAFINYVKSLDK